jgi:hypothetical protein
MGRCCLGPALRCASAQTLSSVCAKILEKVKDSGWKHVICCMYVPKRSVMVIVQDMELRKRSEASRSCKEIPRCCVRYAFGLKFDWCLWVMYTSLCISPHHIDLSSIHSALAGLPLVLHRAAHGGSGVQHPFCAYHLHVPC